jgi:hypothetical protein
MDCKSIRSTYEGAHQLAEKPLPSRPAQPVNPRDLEVYRLHIVEKRTIRELAEKYDRTIKSVWGICTRVRKHDFNNSGEKMNISQPVKSFQE